MCHNKALFVVSCKGDMTFICVGRAFVVSGRSALGGCMASQAPLVPRALVRAGKSGVGLPEVNAHPLWLPSASCLGLAGPLHPWPGQVARIASGAHFPTRRPSQCCCHAKGSPYSQPLPPMLEFDSPMLFSVLSLFMSCTSLACNSS